MKTVLKLALLAIIAINVTACATVSDTALPTQPIGAAPPPPPLPTQSIDAPPPPPPPVNGS